jgi:hypothetical protein
MSIFMLLNIGILIKTNMNLFELFLKQYLNIYKYITIIIISPCLADLNLSLSFIILFSIFGFTVISISSQFYFVGIQLMLIFPVNTVFLNRCSAAHKCATN